MKTLKPHVSPQKHKDGVQATQVTKMIICLHEGDLIFLGVYEEIAVEKFAITCKGQKCGSENQMVGKCSIIVKFAVGSKQWFANASDV